MVSLKEVKNELFKEGFGDSYPYSNCYMVQYKASNGNSFQIYLDEKKPNRVRTLRAMKPNTVSAFGLIGEFVGGKVKGRKFSFNSPKQLIEKLEKWEF